MVKIEDLTEEDISLRDKKGKLVRIAEQIFGEGNVDYLPFDRSILSISPGYITLEPFMVDPLFNIIYVANSNNFEHAVELAKAYEKVFGEDSFTIKREYDVFLRED